MKNALIAVALCLPVVATHADPAVESSARFMAGVGLTVGGDTLATATYTDGTTSNISAGTGVQFSTGVDYRINELFSVQGSVGYQVRFTPQASNGDASFSRFPIELIGYYHLNKQWRVGGGVRFVENPHISASGAASYIAQDYQNTTGAVLEAEYLYSPHLGFKIRAVKESYTPVGQSNSYSGDHIGFCSNFYF